MWMDLMVVVLKLSTQINLSMAVWVLKHKENPWEKLKKSTN